MARQEIILGTAPTGLGGDPPRTASQKINFMTKELYASTESMGSAATRDVQTDSLDSTTGRLMMLGAFGLGVPTAPSLPGADANVSPPTGTYSTGSAWAGSIYPGVNANNQGTLIVSRWALLTYAKQQWSSINTSAGSFERYLVGGVWSDWFRIYTSATATGLIANGGIIERAATASGEIVKYMDGTLAQWGWGSTIVATPAVNSYGSTAGTIYVNNVTITLAAPFDNLAYFASVTATDRGFAILSANKTKTNFISQMQHGQSSQTIPYTWFAIGRWKA